MNIRLLLLTLVLFSGWSCRKHIPAPDPEEKGLLVINMEVNQQVKELFSNQSTPQSKASGTTPLPSELTLEILSGEEIIEKFAPIGNNNKEIELAPGTYTLRAYSALFTTPAFDSPVYADEQTVEVVSNKSSTADLECTQSNAGVQIVYAPEFQQNHTQYSVEIAQNGTTLAFTDENISQIGYFLPGPVTFTLLTDGASYQQTLTLQAQRLYTLEIQDQALPSGSVNLNLSINGSCINETIQISIPANPVDPSNPSDENRQVLYHENFGQAISSETPVYAYTGWENTTVTYSGNLMITKPSNESSLYPEASGGCCLLFPAANREFTITDLNISGASSRELTFGISFPDGTPASSTDISVLVSNDILNIPLTLNITDYEGWAFVTTAIESDFNVSTLTLKALTANLQVDDLQITGMP